MVNIFVIVISSDQYYTCFINLFISIDELWLQTFANKFCGNYIRPANKYEVSSQLECQKLCNKRADCVGISYSHKPGSTGYCYKCLDDKMFHDPGNWFGFYKKPGNIKFNFKLNIINIRFDNQYSPRSLNT